MKLRVEIKKEKDDDVERFIKNRFASGIPGIYVDTATTTTRILEKFPGYSAWKIRDSDRITGTAKAYFIFGRTLDGYVLLKKEANGFHTKMKATSLVDLLEKFNKRYSTAKTAVNINDLLWL